MRLLTIFECILFHILTGYGRAEEVEESRLDPQLGLNSQCPMKIQSSVYRSFHDKLKEVARQNQESDSVCCFWSAASSPQLVWTLQILWPQWYLCFPLNSWSHSWSHISLPESEIAASFSRTWQCIGMPEESTVWRYPCSEETSPLILQLIALNLLSFMEKGIIRSCYFSFLSFFFWSACLVWSPVCILAFTTP